MNGWSVGQSGGEACTGHRGGASSDQLAAT